LGELGPVISEIKRYNHTHRNRLFWKTIFRPIGVLHPNIFTRESSYGFQRVLAITILSVHLSVCLSHGWISQKWCKIGSPNLYHRLPGRF